MLNVREIYCPAHFGNAAADWAEWIGRWGVPFDVDAGAARKQFDRLAVTARPSWRLAQLDSKLKLFEAHHAVMAESDWTDTRLRNARAFWDEKEHLWRRLWGLALTRHILKFDAFAPAWHAEYLQRAGAKAGQDAGRLAHDA